MRAPLPSGRIRTIGWLSGSPGVCPERMMMWPGSADGGGGNKVGGLSGKGVLLGTGVQVGGGVKVGVGCTATLAVGVATNPAEPEPPETAACFVWRWQPGPG